MKAGVNTLLWSGTFSERELPLLRKVKRLGFGAAEVPVFDPKVPPAEKMREMAEKLGIELLQCSIVPPNCDPISDRASVRKRAVKRLKDYIDVATRMGAKAIAGPLYAPVGKIVGRPRTRQEWRWGVSCFKEVMPIAEEAGVTLCIEPINRFETYFINTAEDALAFVKEVGSPNLKIHLDTFHMNIEEKNSPKAILSVKGYLGHVHVSESDRGVPGTGQVDWAGCFKALRKIKYDGWCVVESFHSAIKDIAAAASIWRKLAKSPDEIARGGLVLIKKFYTW